MSRYVPQAIVIVLLVGGFWAALPPASAVIVSDPVASAPEVRGVVHVHTRRSDGGGTLDDVAAAAARAGLQFVVVTDHGDGTRLPEEPSYQHGVLVIDAVEVTTFDGHVLALGIGQAPYRLGGRGEDVVADINRLGGFAIAAHVDSPKESLTWRAWDSALTGFEWLNGDSEWRDESTLSLLPLLAQYLVRPAESVARILDRPTVTLARWDRQSATRRLVTIAAADAHARIGGSQEDEPRWWRRLSLPIPGYESLFRTVSLSVTGVRLMGDPRADAGMVMDAIRSGHTYTEVDGVAHGARLVFTATNGAVSAGPGGALPASGEVVIDAAVPGFRDGVIRLLQDGRVIQEAATSQIHLSVPGTPAVYRVEVMHRRSPGTPPIPWLVSNPIWIGRDERWGRPQSSETDRPEERLQTLKLGDWTVEHSERSVGAVDVVRQEGEEAVLFRYALGGVESSGPFVAAALPVHGMGAADGIGLRCKAERAMRVSVEVRLETPGGDERWRRSIYLDGMTRHVQIPLSAMRRVGEPSSEELNPNSVRSILVVVDGTNTPSGRSGQIWIEGASLVRLR